MTVSESAARYRPGRLSKLDKLLMAHLIAACERAGSKIKFMEKYALHEADISRMTRGLAPVGGRVLRALYADIMELEPSALDRP